MALNNWVSILRGIIALTILLVSHSLFAENDKYKWQHYISLFDRPLYQPGFKHFDRANPDAPKGGHLRLAIHGSFDSLNPYILKGTPPSRAPNFVRYGFVELNEPLMVGTGPYSPNTEEPLTAYGLIAESVAFDPEENRLSFKLRPEARFHDGKPVTTADVAFSYQLLLDKGHPHFRPLLEQVVRVEVESPTIIHFHLNKDISRVLPIRLTELPVLPMHYWKDRDFAKTTTEPPLLSGPYRIVQVTPGQSITYERVKDYWGKDLPVNKGLYNFDKVTQHFFKDRHVAFQAFINGDIDAFIEVQAKNWATGYDLPAVHAGEIIKIQYPMALVPTRRYFAFNNRKPKFADRRVREAISMLFDWEWSGRVLFHNAYVRTTSYFSHDELQVPGLPDSKELKLLEPYRKQLPSDVFNKPFRLSSSQGDGNMNQQKHKAISLLQAAGWKLQKGKLRNARGEPFEIEFLHYSKVLDRIVLPFTHNLSAVGINMTFKSIDMSQYQRRLKQRDFDMIQTTLPMPYVADEQLKSFYHSSLADDPGSQNFMGIKNPVVDDLLEQAIKARTRDDMISAMGALNRVLLWEHYSIPNWHGNTIRVAYWRHLNRPDKLTTYGMQMTSWWMGNKKDSEAH